MSRFWMIATEMDDLARAAQAGDWPAVYAVGEHLSVEITLAAAA